MTIESMKVMKILKTIFTSAALAGALVACGGGGGSSGSQPGKTFQTTAPSSVTLLPGSSGQYDILGGVPPYRVGNSDTAIAVGAVSGTRLYIGAVNAGSSLVNVVDNSGATVGVTVNVGTSTPLTSTAPDALTIGVGAASMRTFTIRGGVPPYAVESSNANTFTATKIGTNQFSVTGVAIGSGVVTVTDATNTKLGVNVTVGAPELRVSPTDLKIFPGIDAVVKISGGQPPYKVAGGIPSAIQADISGDEMHIKGLLASKLELGVADATGQTVKVTVEVTNGTGVFNIMPGSLSITEDDNQDIRLNIYGAAPGPVCFFTDRTQLQPQVGGCPSNPSIVTLVTGSAGSRCVSGNTNVTLTAVDSNGAIANAIVTIVDNGKCAAQALTASANSVTVRAKTATIDATSAQVLIYGGSGTYAITSTNSGVASAAIAGNVLTIKGGDYTGTASVTVYDQQQPTFSVTITVTAN